MEVLRILKMKEEIIIKEECLLKLKMKEEIEVLLNKIKRRIGSIFIVRDDTYLTTPPYLIQTDDPRPIGLQIEINH